MRVLIIKTSSLGDIIHTFPALTDATRAIKGIRFDWVVEESFAQLPAWHAAVDLTIPSAVRRWRRSLFTTWLSGSWKQFVKQLRQRRYDAVIDAQGLIKSAVITRKAYGHKHGLDKHSAREPLSSWFCDSVYSVERQQHAVERTRQLFAKALGYTLPDAPPQYELSVTADGSIDDKTILFLHGTTWNSKRWPMSFWLSLAALVVDDDYRILVPAGNEAEREFAQTLAEASFSISALAEKSLTEMATIIKATTGIVSVDTGLAHLAMGLKIPLVGLYGATDSSLTGIMGDQQQSLQADIDCSPCLQRVCPKLSKQVRVAPCTQTLTAESVWNALKAKL